MALRFLHKLFGRKILQSYTLEVLAQERHLGEIRDFITRIAEETGFSLHEVNNIKLALDEACSNVVRHAYRGMEPGPIRLEVKRRAGEIEVWISDQGRNFDWKNTRTPDLNRYVEIGKKGGLGIWFIRKLMDEAEYRTTPRGNQLRLVKRLKTAASQPEAIAPLPQAGPAVQPVKQLMEPRSGLSVKIKFLLPVTGSVVILVLVIFAYMFSNQAASMREEIMTNVTENTRQLARDAVNYLIKQDDLHLTAMVKTLVRTNPKLDYAFIVDNDGIVVAHSITEKMFKPYPYPPGFRFPQGQGALIQSLRDSQHHLINDIAYPITMGELRLGRAHIGIREEAIRRDIAQGRRSAAVIFLVVLVVSTTGAYLLMSVLVAPIRKLTDGMQAISDGRLDHRIVIQSNDEFGQIAGVFNEMTQRFEQAQKNLIEQERIQQEMQVAQEIQHTLLPREVPQIEGYDVASLYRSAKEVGGDYFDFVWVDDNMLGIAVADVSGKGIPGSLVMTMIRTALRLEARGNRSATEVMAKVNTFVTRDMKKGMFVTMFYIILDSRQRVINYSSAGHNPMILYREENDQVYFLKPRGFPLGIDLPDPNLFAKSLTQENVSLKKGDLLLAYTDGITEAMNPRREQFGETRLIQFIRENRTLSADEFVKNLSAAIVEFTEDFPQNDDITCVAIKEKLMADDLQFNLRRRLFYLVEHQGVSVAEACRHLKLSASTYYRLKRLRDQHGVQALKMTVARKDVQILQVSLGERQALMNLIMAHPDFGTKRLVQALEEAGLAVNEKAIQQELKRLRLTTADARKAFVNKKKVD